jgi:RND family efflux transporter MFP subunit
MSEGRVRSEDGCRRGRARATWTCTWTCTIAIACAWLTVACRHPPDEEDDKRAAATVTCVAVETATIDDTIDVTGVIAPPPKVDAIVSSPIAGRVAQVAVEEGDHVDAGALLATIEDPALPAGSIEAKAAVSAAQAAKVAADQEVARQERLVNAGIGARKELDDARARAAAAAAELDAANARAGLATTRLARREVRAPRAGVVLHLWRRVGESVDGTATTPIAEIADLAVLEVHAQVAPVALAPLREGMTAHVVVLGVDAPVAASIVRVAPAVDPSTLFGLVRLRLERADNLKVGVAATAQIVIRQRPGLRVPATALRRSMVGADEVVVCDAGVARVRVVTVGNRTDTGVELKDGVKPGEQVVVDHVLGLEDGQALAAPATEPIHPTHAGSAR